MKAEGWLCEEQITKGRFRGTLGVGVDWENTPWSNANTEGNGVTNAAPLGQEENCPHGGVGQLSNDTSND